MCTSEHGIKTQRCEFSVLSQYDERKWHGSNKDKVVRQTSTEDWKQM